MLSQSHVVGTPVSLDPCGWAIHLNYTFYTTQVSTKRERASKNTEEDTSFRHLVEKANCPRKHWLLPQYLKDERAGFLWVMKFVNDFLPHHPQNRWTWGCRSEKNRCTWGPPTSHSNFSMHLRLGGCWNQCTWYGSPSGVDVG